MNNPSALRRIWLLTAQVIAISAAVLIAWRAFGPVLRLHRLHFGEMNSRLGRSQRWWHSNRARL